MHFSTLLFKIKENQQYQSFCLYSGKKAATQAIIKYGMSIVGQSTLFLNLGQILIMEVDAPFFALAKHIQ